MNRIGMVVVGAALAAALCYGQDSTSAAAPAAVFHGGIPVKVSKTLDSSKLKEGDAVEVETAGSFKMGETLVPKGSKLMGHVIAAKARSKGDPDSQLTLAFEKLNAANGKQLPLKGMVQAVFPPSDEPAGPNMATAGTSAGGSAAGASPAGVGLTNTKNGSDMQSSSSGQLVLDVKATGVRGVDNLQLDNGVLSSKGKNVKLSGGVRMIVHVDILG
jgi:hypothetical protein